MNLKVCYYIVDPMDESCNIVGPCESIVELKNELESEIEKGNVGLETSNTFEVVATFGELQVEKKYSSTVILVNGTTLVG